LMIKFLYFYLSMALFSRLSGNKFGFPWKVSLYTIYNECCLVPLSVKFVHYTSVCCIRVCVSVYVCLFVCLCVYAFMCLSSMSACFSILSVFLCVYLSIRLSVHLSVRLSVCLSSCLPVFWFRLMTRYVCVLIS
jgi:hypothetical protein